MQRRRGDGATANPCEPEVRMFEVLILVCSANLLQPECQQSTARDVIHGPMAASLMECFVGGQAYVAENLPPQGLERSYLKIRCARPNPPTET
jgi:hypothetical protein